MVRVIRAFWPVISHGVRYFDDFRSPSEISGKRRVPGLVSLGHQGTLFGACVEQIRGTVVGSNQPGMFVVCVFFQVVCASSKASTPVTPRRSPRAKTRPTTISRMLATWHMSRSLTSSGNLRWVGTYLQSPPLCACSLISRGGCWFRLS